MDSRSSASGNAPDLEIPEAIALFINRNRPNWKGETARTYRKSLDTFEDFAADEDIDTIGELEMWRVGRYTDYLLNQDYARVTVQDVADRAATTPDVIRRYYDRPDLDAELRRRIMDFDGIDLCKHSEPGDVNEVIAE